MTRNILAATVLSLAIGGTIGVFIGMKYQEEKSNRENLTAFYGYMVSQIAIYSRLQQLVAKGDYRDANKLIEGVKDGAKLTEELIGKNLTEKEKIDSKKPYKYAP